MKDAHKNRDLAKIETTLAALNTAWQAASEDMYKAQNANAANGNANGANAGADANANGSTNEEAKKDGEVTDVDFEEVKDDKKK